jgi:hypothetical protein
MVETAIAISVMLLSLSLSIGAMMLGYNEKDIAIMTDAIEDAIKSGRLADEITDGLEKARDFLDGLWSEGYFD